MQMKPLAELFGIPEETQQEDLSVQIMELALSEVRDFSDHPFAVKMDADMAELVESVKQNGVLHPGIARPMRDGGYEIIAGHRRKMACSLAGISSMPFMVREYSDEEAVIIMVESNIQRSRVSIREKAFSYRMHMEAQKRLTAAGREKRSQDMPGGKEKAETGRSDEILARRTGESRNTIQRYIRLTYLIPELMDMTDAGRIPMITASDLSYLNSRQQTELFGYMEAHHIVPSGEQAKILKEISRKGSNFTSEELLNSIFSEGKAADRRNLVFKKNTLSEYFPKNYKTEDMEKVIIGLRKQWRKEQGIRDTGQIPGQTDIETLEGGRYMPG